MNIYLENTVDSYRTFLRIKELPRYEIHAASSRTLFDAEAVA